MTGLLIALALLPLLLPAFSLLLLTLAALTARTNPSQGFSPPSTLPRLTILVPAHNESIHVLPTLANLLAQLGPHDRLLLVADNCSDDTASLARQAGAEVIERNHPTLRGKGYALAFGVDYLRADPPEVVLVVDADCFLSEGAAAAIGRDCQQSGKPVQMLDLMNAQVGSSLRFRVLEFAMLVKNKVRPLGSYRLGRACHLMGTGMALPWNLIATAELATGHIAEDMKLGVELTKAGHAPRFLVTAQVSSAFVNDSGVAKVQKSRWEHGHLATLIEELPSLLRSALRKRDPALIVLALDLMIPPISFYFLLLTALWLATALTAGLWPVLMPALVLSTLAVGCFSLATALAWFFFGRHLLSARELLSTPLYALWKLPVYLAFFMKKRSAWIRTNRDSD
ncbi:MAG: glycosyltransferase family 2 protein [Burkholderiaceae bacterium]